MVEFELKKEILKFRVFAVPRASKSEVAGEREGALRVRIAAPPVDGAANKELVKILSKFFGVSKSNIEVTAGTGSRRKTVTLNDPNAAAAADLLRKAAS